MARGDITPGDNPKPFKKGENGGRKGKRYVPKEVVEFNRYMGAASKSDLRMTPLKVKTALEYLLGLPLEEIRKIAGSPTDANNRYPVILRLAAYALLEDRFKAVLDILKQIHGQTAYLKVESTTRFEFVNIDDGVASELHTLIASAVNDSEPALSAGDYSEADADFSEVIDVSQ